MLARTGDERAVLTSFLDFHRAVVVRKLRGLSDADARRRLVPSATTLVGLVKHLTLVERNWFPTLLAP
ncbi:mycothiol transferase, partial [Micromonospora ureilytica]|uniref:mycothiol transferase n=1 Tax=Micromonospora ureilytica TaxID=709868 RepID=UPI00197C65EE